MADRQIQIGLRFNADTSQAKAAIQDLQTSLFKISSAGSMQGTKQELAQAATAAKELSYHLNQAYNANTGNLDLSKLDKSLKASGTNVTKLSSQLLQAGTTGQQAFVQLAQSIAAAERPMITLSSRMSNLFTTIKNTAKWQISSSILHGFMGAVQTAYGYSKDLNESLNNIRIVTESNADQMARFAEQANKAAKALSATTTEYTNASLIYFQQGLSEQQVKERTDVTIKMANVSGQSAETVSDQLTAVWNNFYDGSKSLEYYADVMTKLGAATASSSDEIAEGLEKFAAVSGTVGLSYEYATAALATVTAETRQSADVVGTAFKTMFARIQGLKLGETLEDGTTLNQYSQALMAVGVNIKDSNGELKKMDQILNEMANVWETLNRDEKAALAQKVAGIRQYNQLMSLMENWDVMEENLGFVSVSEGSLQKQQEIYEESWAAASDRVRASMEAIYSDLIDDDFFIDLANGFSSLIDSLDAFIDGFGGVKMIVVSVASILMSTFAHKVPGALENLKANFNVVFKGAQHEAQRLSQTMINTTNQALKQENFNLSDQTALQNSTNLLAIKNKISAVQSQLTNKEQQQYDLETQIIVKQQEELQALAKKAMAEQENIDNLFEEMELIDSTSSVRAQREKEELSLVQAKRDAEIALSQTSQGRTNAEKEAYATAKMNYDSATQALVKYRAETEVITGSQANFTNVLLANYTALMKNNNGIITTENEYVDVSNSLEDFTIKLEKLNTTLNNPKSKAGSSVGMTKSIQDIISNVRNIRNEVKQITGDSMPELDEAFEKVSSSNSPEKLKTSMAQLVDTIKNAKIPTDQLGKILSKMGYETQINKLDKEYRNLSKTTQDLTNKQKALNQRIKEFTPTHVVTGLERITQAAAGLGQVAMLATSVRSIFQAWNDDDLSFGEKLTTTFMSLSMIVPSAIGVLKSFNTVTSIGNQSLISSILTQRAYNASIKDGTTQIAISSAAKRLYHAEDKEGATIAVANMMARRGLITEEEKEVFVLALTTKLKDADNEETTESILQSTLLQFSKKGEVASYFATAAAQIKETAAKGQGIIAGGAHIAVLIGEKLAAWGLNEALAPLVGVFIVLALAIGAVVAIGYGLYKVFQIVKESTPEAKLEAAKEKAEELKTALDETTTAAENLKTAFDDYDSLVEKLENCVRGTKEWRDTLAEVNQAALKILEDNPELYNVPGAIERDETTGMIKITEEGQQYLQDKAYQRTLTASAESNMANQDVHNKEIEIIKKNIESQFTMSGNQTGMGAWSTFDSTTYDALKQVSKDFTSSDYNTTDIMKALNTEDSNDSRIQKILELKDEINNLSQSVKENTLATETETQAIASNILAGDEDFQKSSYADEISVNIGKVYDRIIEDSTNSYLEKISSDSEQAEIAVQKYISENGLSNLKGFTAEEPNDDGSFSYSYIDANNETQTKEVTADQIATTLATIDAMDGLIDAANSLADIFSEIDSNERDAQGERYDEALKGFLSGDQDALFGLTKDDLSGVKDDFTTYINSDTEAQKYGFKNLDEFKSIIDQEIQRVNDAWSGLGEDFSEYTLEEAQGLNEAAENSGYGLEKIKEYYNNLSEEEKTLFLQIDFDENKTQQAWNEQLKEFKEQQNLAIDQEYITKAEGLKIDTEEFKAYRDLLRETTSDYDDNVKGLNEVAIANKRLEKGVKSLANNWEDFDEVMSDSNSSIEDVSAILPDINEGLIDVLNISKEDFELLPADFAQKNWSLIQDVMNNVEGAVDDLRDKAGEEILMTVNGVLDKDGTLKEDFEGLHEAIASFDSEEFEVGMAINKDDYQAFYDNCQAMIDAAGMTADEASAYFASMGYNVNFKKDKKKVTETVWDYTYSNKYDDQGNLIEREVEGTPKVLTGEVEVPVIETITPNGSYGGDINVTTTASPSMTADKTKSSSGGSKSSKLKTSDETERYHEVNEELDDLNRKLDQMGKKSDKAFGAQKIAYMNKELKLLNKTIDAQKEKLSEIEKNLSTDQATLNQYGAKYDKEGRITNYDEIVAAETEKYNQAIDSGNEKTIELAEKRYEDFKKSLEQYEETLNLLEEEEISLQDYLDLVAEKKLAIIQYKLEIGLELNERDMKELDYQLKRLEDKAFSQAERIILYQQQSNILAENAKLYQDSATELLKNKGLNKKEREAVLAGDYSVLEGIEFTQDEIETLKTAADGLMEVNEQLYEMDKLVKEELINSFEEWNEKIDDALSKFDHYNSLLENFKDLVDILGAENLGLSKDFLNELGKAQVENMKNETSGLMSSLSLIDQQVATAKEKLAEVREKGTATDENGVAQDEEFWENYLKEAEARQQETQENILANTVATVQQIEDLYLQAIDDTFAEFDDRIAGSFKSLEDLTKAYDRAKKIDEQYLADYKKLYELNKLNRDIEKSIDETDSIKSKKALRELQAEIAEYEKDGVEMSQYDLEYMQKKYDLRLAEIALEEAQNAKSQVRLTRDASGNYSYTYTAKEEDMAEAEQKRDDALYAAQDLNETYISEQTERIPELLGEMEEELAEAAKIKDDDEREAAMEKIRADYETLIQQAMNEITKAGGNNAELFTTYKDLFAELGLGASDFTLSFSDTIMSSLTDFETLEEWWTTIKNSIGDKDTKGTLLGDLAKHTTEYKDATNEALGLIGTSWETLGEKIKLWVYGEEGKGGIVGASKDTKEEIDGLATDAAEDFKTLLDKLDGWKTEWNKKLQSVIDQNDATRKSYNELIKALAQTYKDPKNVSTNKQRNITENVIITKYETQGDSKQEKKQTDDNDDPPNDDPPNDDVSKNYKKYIHPNRITPVMAEEFWSRLGWTYQERGGASMLISSYKPNEQYVFSGFVKEEYLKAAKNLGYTVKEKTTSPWGYYIISPTNPTWMKSFDTGGYTGVWGTAGKLAMLHEKELVLNKWDTENILNVVSMVRELAKSIDFNAQLTSQGLGALSIAAAANPDHKLEQEVIIHAEFPGVRDRHEIEEAFTSLVNRATQFANRY